MIVDWIVGGVGVGLTGVGDGDGDIPNAKSTEFL